MKNSPFQLTGTITKMSSVYNTATVCPFEEQNCSETSKNRLTLDPHITDKLASSRNFDELKYLWIKWRDASGKKMRSDYKIYVDLMNKVAVGNEHTDASAYWKDDFEDPNFEATVDALWLQVKPLYDQLHTYMRYKLMEIYGMNKGR